MRYGCARRSFWTVCGLTQIVGGVAAQQPDTVTLPPVVVTANRIPTTLNAVSSAVTVISAARTRLEEEGRSWGRPPRLSPLEKARVAELHGISGHADRAALLRWLGGFRAPPKKLFLSHGEEQVSLALAEHVRGSLGWDVAVPHYQDVAELEEG